MFGQIPDTLEDVWILTAMGNKEEAKLKIDSLPDRHPFDIKYNTSAHIPTGSWEHCSNVLNELDKSDILKTGWVQ